MVEVEVITRLTKEGVLSEVRSGGMIWYDWHQKKVKWSIYGTTVEVEVSASKKGFSADYDDNGTLYLKFKLVSKEEAHEIAVNIAKELVQKLKKRLEETGWLDSDPLITTLGI
jgi:D-hexose-6-phosphate mutarotase